MPQFSMIVGYGAEKITFHLRMVSMAEEQRYTQRFADLVDTLDSEERAKKEYAILVESLVNWSSAMPVRRGEDTKDLDVALGEGTLAEAIHAYFDERTDTKERILNATVVAFRNRLTPEVSFL